MAKNGRLKNCGQLWTSEDKNENPMLSGNIDLGVLGKINVLILKNGQQKEASHPDYLVFTRDEGEKQILQNPPKKKGL